MARAWEAARTIGIGGIVILFVLSLIFGRDLVSPVLQQQAEVPQTTGEAPPAADDAAGGSQGRRDRLHAPRPRS